MTGRERVLNVLFPNRGAIANAAEGVRETHAQARMRAEASRALEIPRARVAPDDRLTKLGRG